jgi:hypothetical protein
MSRRSALRAVAAASRPLEKSGDVQRQAICAASEAGASLDEIASKAGLPHEEVRRIVGAQAELGAYCVTVERRGVSPLKRRLVVRAPSREMARALATWIAERSSGGMFEATRVHRAKHFWTSTADTYDDADLWPSSGPSGLA